MGSYVLDDMGPQGSTAWAGGIKRGEGCFPDGRASAAILGDAVAERLPGDWRSYKSLQFTLYNPWRRVAHAGFAIHDQAALDSPELEYGDCIEHGEALLLGEGITHVVVQIDPIMTQRGNRMLDLANVRRFFLRFPGPMEGEAPISIAGLRLCEEVSEVDSLAQARPGDSITFIKHLDISCYTYKPELYVEPGDIVALAGELEAEMKALEDAIRVAQINGKQTHYENAVMLAADVALKSRPLLAWHFSPNAKRRNMTEALSLVREAKEKLLRLLSFKQHEDDEDDTNVAFSLVKPVPDLGKLTISGNKLLGPDGKPVLVCAMSYHNEGALMEFFAPEKHKAEIYAVGGGSRYDIEWSPVYRAFHAHPGTERVGWKGWCGHLIKDQWAMGGRKENVVLCLENQHILAAIEEYNQMHAGEWVNLPGLAYIILAYELSYLCYCDESLRRFRLWLRERHHTIEALNEKWGTAYQGFDEATPPPTEGHGPVPDANRAAWFDWADWNMRRFTDHLKWSYQSARRLHPTMPICAGGSHSMISANVSTSGIDEELIIDEIDDVVLHEGRDLMGLDLLGALSEYKKPLVDPEQGGSCEGWLLNYLHGKSTISMFWWPKQPSRQFPKSTLYSPVHGTMPIAKVLEHLTTALDVRRLSEEITAFWEVPRQAAILYSRTSMIQVEPAVMAGGETPYLSSLRASYDAARCLDAGVTFVSERQLLKGKGGEYKLLILPAVEHLPSDVFDALDVYVRGGGTVVVTPESLTSDEYNRPADYLSRWGVSIRESIVPGIAGYGEAHRRYDQNIERSVQFEQGVVQTATRFMDTLVPCALTTSGLLQRVDTEGEIAAADEHGAPVLLHIERGAGHVWYLTGTPDSASMHALLDQLFEKAGIQRHIRVTDALGNRVAGLEARLVRRQYDDLVYLANGSGQATTFRFETDRPYQGIRELRSMRFFASAEGVLENDQVLLFSLRIDPTKAE